MATKKSKKTSKRPAKKSVKKLATKSDIQTAKVELDAATVHEFESRLRDGLVASGAVMSTDNKTPELQPGAKVDLDPATAARLSETLRHGLVSSQAVMATDSDQLDKMTGDVKGGPPRLKSKKR
jgi:hypothetical protein